VGAVALLVANDWLLKGSGLLPGGLTGKLSDVAGMLVAPVVLATLLALARVPPSRGRWVAVAAVGLVFAALKLDAGFAARFDGLVNAGTRALRVPLAARTATDPTDLLVLPLLVVGAPLAGRLARDAIMRRSGALLAGALACAATSPAYVRLAPHWSFADERLDGNRMWAERLDDGAVVVQLGRQSSDGSFEVGVELAAREGPLSLAAADVLLSTPGERVAARAAAGTAATTLVRPGRTELARFILWPRTRSWPKGAHGTLELVLEDGERLHPVRLDLTYDERIVRCHTSYELR
jgi:hypothetical protein